MDKQDIMDIAKETTKEIAKDVYADAGKPVLKPTGELVGLVPRAIKAALCPLEKWIMQREFNIEETKKLLEEKLQNTPVELIESPEPHIAVPAVQYISYCMDNNELRDMYANLLANSMNKVVKNGVHPAFVEIIKQLSPDEAKILRYLYNNPLVPTIGLRVIKAAGGQALILPLFTNITELCDCEDIQGYKKHIDNLTRLGLIEPPNDQQLTDKKQYEPLKNHPFILQQKSSLEALDTVSRVDFKEGYMELTALGKSFCGICLTTQTISVIITDDK